MYSHHEHSWTYCSTRPEIYVQAASAHYKPTHQTSRISFVFFGQQLHFCQTKTDRGSWDQKLAELIIYTEAENQRPVLICGTTHRHSCSVSLNQWNPNLNPNPDINQPFQPPQPEIPDYWWYRQQTEVAVCPKRAKQSENLDFFLPNMWQVFSVVLNYNLITTWRSVQFVYGEAEL